MKRSSLALLSLVVGAASTFGLGNAAADQIYVSNNGGNTIDAISSSGVITTFATGGANNIYLNGPTGLVFNSSGDLFVANNGSGDIEEFSATGAPLRVVASGLSGPRGLTIDGLGNLYVANQASGTIDKITPGGAVTTFFSGLVSPNGLAFNAAGDLLVTEGPGIGNTGNSIINVSPNGTSSSVFATDIASDLNDPNGIAISSNGNVFIVNSMGTSGIEEFSSTGTLIKNFSNVGLNNPKALAFDSNGNLYVTNAFSDQITEYGSTGAESLFASNPDPTSNPNSLNFPSFITTTSTILAQSAPEPSTYALIVGGIGLLFFVVRRKSGKKL